MILIKYLPGYITWEWILELIIIHFSASMFSNVEITHKFSVNHIKSQKFYLDPQLFTQQKNISCKETFDKSSFQNPNTGEIKLVMLAT